MKVIGTAGHVDHGKSTLVERLTGINPDRLIEERRRGMTIDLGFASITLPSGSEAGIVDVPGHERFVKNMLAGVGGIDVALLVVAADEGVMPQTREHLDIIDLLGISKGVVALTKTDLVDEEWLELAREEVADLVSSTSIAESAILPVSSVTGSGIETLLAELDRLVVSGGEQPNTGVPYLPVDRVFTISGFGTVVTGTLHGGELHVGQEVRVTPGDKRARIRTLQSHGRSRETADPRTRIAVNLSGLRKEDVERGDTVHLPRTVLEVRRFDARVRVLDGAPAALAHGSRVSVHVGAAERIGIVSSLGKESISPGSSGWVQIRLRVPVAAIRGQRFILRLPAPMRTIAGGEVVDIRPHHRRGDVSALGRLERVKSERPDEVILGILADHRARSTALIALVAGLPIEPVKHLLRDAVESGGVVARGDTFVSQEGWSQLSGRATHLLAAYHDANPLKRGMAREELRRKLRISSADWPTSQRLLVKAGAMCESGPLVSLPDRPGGTAGRREEAERILVALSALPFAPPTSSQLKAVSGTDDALLSAMVDEGEIVRVGAGVYLLREAYDQMVRASLEAIARDGTVTVAALRDRFGTSRKYALAFLEHLDSERVTRRIGDARVLGSKRPACA